MKKSILALIVALGAAQANAGEIEVYYFERFAECKVSLLENFPIEPETLAYYVEKGPGKQMDTLEFEEVMNGDIDTKIELMFIEASQSKEPVTQDSLYAKVEAIYGVWMDGMKKHTGQVESPFSCPDLIPGVSEAATEAVEKLEYELALSKEADKKDVVAFIARLDSIKEAGVDKAAAAAEEFHEKKSPQWQFWKWFSN